MKEVPYSSRTNLDVIWGVLNSESSKVTAAMRSGSVILVVSDSDNSAGSKPDGGEVVIAESGSGDAVLKDLIVRKKLAILGRSHDLEYL